MSTPIVAGIYARKSTSQDGTAEEEKSVARQVARATECAAAHGWLVVNEHIYIDDGISGAEFERRPGLTRLLAAVKSKGGAPFQVLIMSERSRLGREVAETGYILKKIRQAGVKVWVYLDDRELAFDTPVDQMMEAVLEAVDQMERHHASQRTKDSLLRKAQAGYVPGGRTFGYDNVRVNGHVERRINEVEAGIVRRIYELCAQGYGFKRIAHTLNAESAPAPRPTHGAPQGWAPTSVRDILHRPLYNGEHVWNKTKKRDAYGQRQSRRQTSRRSETEVVRVEKPEWRIVPELLWQEVQSRLARTRQTYIRRTDGRLMGRPPSGLAGKHLLPGLAVCGVCAGSIEVVSRSHGKQRAFFYACRTNMQKGAAVCPNRMLIPLAAADRAVLESVSHHLLREDVVRDAVTAAVARLRSAGRLDDQRDTLRARLTTLEEECQRLTSAIAAGGDLPTLVAAVKDREGQRAQVAQALAELDGVERIVELDGPRLAHALRDQLTDWQGLLAGATGAGPLDSPQASGWATDLRAGEGCRSRGARAGVYVPR